MSRRKRIENQDDSRNDFSNKIYEKKILRYIDFFLFSFDLNHSCRFLDINRMYAFQHRPFFTHHAK